MKRRFRLHKRTDFERVRRTGTSYAHPLIVLVVLPVAQGWLRVGVAAGRSVGGAVARNRAKRRLRAIVSERIDVIRTGYDIVFLARKPVGQSSHQELTRAVDQVLRRARLINRDSDDN